MDFKTTIFVAFIAFTSLYGQDDTAVVWHNPIKIVDKFEGQGWENIDYNRLPDKAEKMVRTPLWNLSRNSAGLQVLFETDASSIAVRYKVSGNHSMPHMPATGVSGVDLYVKKDNEWVWCRGRYQFNDTITYDYNVNFTPLGVREYQLFLPLYNSVKDLSIGVPIDNTFVISPIREPKPIVIYGTSIAQGACASRPGMAWTNILSRKLDHPIINLGFSGNGRLESELIELLTEIDASIYILDCLPNLSPNENRTKAEIQKRIVNSVGLLKEKRPNTPILLVQHAGYSDGLVNSSRKDIYETLNSWMSETFEQLKSQDVQDLYMLSKEEIALGNDAFVDGTHPTDLGMQKYANAYEKMLIQIKQK